MHKLFNVQGKVAIITGGAGMLGTEYARALAGAGARVALFDILKPTPLARHAKRLAKECGSDVLGVSIDVTNEKDVARAVKRVIRTFGRIDILVNNAALTDLSGAYNRFAPYEDFPLVLWKKEVEVTLTGSFLVMRAVAPHMMKAKSGVVVNIASVYGAVGPDNRIYEKGKFRSIAYATAKSGIYNFTRALASYFAPYGIRVNTLTLGGVFAGHGRRFTKAYGARAMLGRMMRREECRGPMLFLSSDASSYMTGANLIIDGGWTAW